MSQPLHRQSRTKKALNWKITFRWEGPGRRRRLVRLVHADTRAQAKMAARQYSFQTLYHPVKFELVGGGA